MTRTLALDGLAAAVAAAGLTLLVKPAAARALLRPGLLRLGPGEPARYGARILGAMLFAAGLFLAGFALAFSLASAA